MGILRKTRSVAIVLEEFNNIESAISTVKLVNNLQSRINKSTIYRILDKLEDDGVLHSVMFLDPVEFPMDDVPHLVPFVLSFFFCCVELFNVVEG